MGIIKNIFKKKEIGISNVPKHIAIIMDGNGRWAKKRGFPRSAGHKAGAENLIQITQTCYDIGVKYLTVYAFSTENWNRPESEVNYLMNLFSEYLQKMIDDTEDKNVKIKIIGDVNKLPKELISKIEMVENKTKDKDGIQLNLAINYGGRDEILSAVKEIVKDYRNDNAKAVEELDVNAFQNYLYTKDIPDPDLIIRPSGELRISNFLLFQAAYSEFWFAKINWPDFSKEHLMEAISDYQKRNRRFGGI